MGPDTALFGLVFDPENAKVTFWDISGFRHFFGPATLKIGQKLPVRKLGQFWGPFLGLVVAQRQSG